MLLEVNKDGKHIPAVAVMNKDALLFILNRVTGEPVFGVTETPVPKSPVAGETAWPTQPDAQQAAATGAFQLLAGRSGGPDAGAACGLRGDDREGPSHRLERFQPIPPITASSAFPAAKADRNGRAARSTPSSASSSSTPTISATPKSWCRRPNGEMGMVSGRFVDRKTGLDCQNPPWGQLTAVNVNTGDIAWQVRLGISDSLPEGKKDTGRPSKGGPIVTASGLTFIAGTDDQRFRAFDSRTGKELWTYKLDYSGPCHAHHLSGQGRPAICGAWWRPAVPISPVPPAATA